MLLIRKEITFETKCVIKCHSSVSFHVLEMKNSLWQLVTGHSCWRSQKILLILIIQKHESRDVSRTIRPYGKINQYESHWIPQIKPAPRKNQQDTHCFWRFRSLWPLFVYLCEKQTNTQVLSQVNHLTRCLSISWTVDQEEPINQSLWDDQ